MDVADGLRDSATALMREHCVPGVLRLESAQAYHPQLGTMVPQIRVGRDLGTIVSQVRA